MFARLKQKTLRFYLGQSFGAHIAIALIALLVTKVTFDSMEDTKKKNLKLIEASVRVDIVAMPKLTIKELKAMGAGAGEAPEVKIETPKSQNTSDVEFNKAKKNTNFLDRLKALSKKKVKKAKKVKKQQPKRVGNNLAGTDTSALADLVKEGNKISKGTALVGSSSAQAKTEYDTYVSKLPEMIRPFWKLPSYLIDKDLNCRVRIYLSETGKLLNATIYEESGDPSFDAKALEAVKRAAPFPKLLQSFKERGVRGDILLGFPL